MRELENKFNLKRIKNLIAAGTIITEGKSRLRQDDMEMVYWSEARIPNESDKIKDLLKIKDQVFYYVVNVVNQNNRHESNSNYFESTTCLNYKKGIIEEAIYLQIIEPEDYNLVEFANPIKETEYREAEAFDIFKKLMKI